MYRLNLQGKKSASEGTIVSKWLQTEPRVGNNQLYKNKESRLHGKSKERRGVGSVLKVNKQVPKRCL
jgi:hypothetical protein